MSTLSIVAPETMKSARVNSAVLALGSNYRANYYLIKVRKKLATLGILSLSTAFENPDFTATRQQPKSDYTNQCVQLELSPPLSLQQLQHRLKQFENDCDRQRQSSSSTHRALANQAVNDVSMDIDILLVELASTDGWVVMADRYPFKAHESVGVAELFNQQKDYVSTTSY